MACARVLSPSALGRGAPRVRLAQQQRALAGSLARPRKFAGAGAAALGPTCCHAGRSFSTSASTSASAPLISPRPPIPPEVVHHRKHKANVLEDDDLDSAPPPLSKNDLSLVYTFTTPPPISALSAFASRLALSTSSPTSHSLADHLPLLEQTLIHQSFWNGVSTLPTSTTPRTFTHFHDSSAAHNASLATLGNSLLGTLTSELILTSFPALPTRVTKEAVTMYAGPKSLAAIASSWGVAPTRLERSLVGTGPEEDQKRMKRSEKAYGHLVGGRGGARKSEKSAIEGAAGAGLIRWNRKSRSVVDDAILYEDALASVARAVVGAIYQVHGFVAARSFVHSHFLSRLLPSPTTTLASPTAISDLVPLLKFDRPTHLLANKLRSFSLPSPSHRLLKESGRLSSRPTFLSGVFSGDKKIGEGFGSSIKMSEHRASEDALRRLYFAGREEGEGLPSDGWAR